MDSTQNKLLLLFVFDKMEMPLSEQTILEMCCSANNWINYIDCKQALMQLIDANFVAAVNKGASNEAMYSITPEGRICLAHFFVRIPSSLREVVSDNVKLNRMNYKRKQEYRYQKGQRAGQHYLPEGSEGIRAVYIGCLLQFLRLILKVLPQQE